jgi:NAD(P)-dependent dehydrogenase (short-subunit alcohol dehydrogenase family)
LKADLSQEKEIDSIVNETIERFSRIDVLINCAGMNIRKRLTDYSSEDWDRVLNVNLRSVFLLSIKVSQNMKKTRYGKIVNISSIQSEICWTVNNSYSPVPYCASKAGLNSLTRSFAVDLAPYGINVNAVCPSVLDGKWAGSYKEDKGIYNHIIERTPMKRFCTYDDIVGPVMLFASDYGNFITGQCLMVDGGWTLE